MWCLFIAALCHTWYDIMRVACISTYVFDEVQLLDFNCIASLIRLKIIWPIGKVQFFAARLVFPNN